MSARALAAILLVAAAAQPPQSARVVIGYVASSEDEPSNPGRLAVPLPTSGAKTAWVWEAGCRMAAASDREPPGDADQSWTFVVDLVRGSDNLPAARLRYRHTSANGRATPEETRVLRLDSADALDMNEVSARTDCRYDRVHITASAETARATSAAVLWPR